MATEIHGTHFSRPRRSRAPIVLVLAGTIAGVCLISVLWLAIHKHTLSADDDARYFPLTFEFQEATEACIDGGTVRHGKYRAWWTDSETWLFFTVQSRGPLGVDANYVNGRLDGLYIAWHRNGRVFVVGEYVDGEKHGEWLYYEPDGTLVTRSIYDHGIALQK